MNLCHSCRYNPPKFNTSPRGKMSNLAKTFSGFLLGKKTIFSGFCWKKIPDTSRSSVRPILPTNRMSFVCHQTNRHRDVTFGSASPTQFGREGGLARRRGSSNANHLRHTVRHMEGIYPQGFVREFFFITDSIGLWSSKISLKKHVSLKHVFVFHVSPIYSFLRIPWFRCSKWLCRTLKNTAGDMEQLEIISLLVWVMSLLSVGSTGQTWVFAR